MSRKHREAVRKKIAFKLNGSNRTMEVDPDRSLLDVLREDLRLTGTKRGCDGGQCGACSVLINGSLQRSCITPIGKVEGKEILTIEGLGTLDHLHPIQEAFIETAAIQCGFCTPGMILAAKALLDRNPGPSLEEVKQALDKNLCRCTGYTKIFDAVLLASKRMIHSVRTTPTHFERSVVGKNVPMLDAAEKATGTAKYGDDLSFPAMLYGKVVRSPHAHAKIISIETGKALALPGVTAVITAADISGPNVYGRYKKDWPILCRDRVRFLGDPVALVVAESERRAEEALAQIEVHYDLLPSVSDATEALLEAAPSLHPGGNICSEKRIVTGDVEGGFKESDQVLRQIYLTHFAEHAYLEPEAGVGYIDEECRVVVAAGTQSPHSARDQIAHALGLEREEVRVIQTKTGGGFGGKHDVAIHGLLALAAWKLRRPVKIRYSRRESITTTCKRHPFWMDLKVGVDQKGNLRAMEAHYLANTGAYTGSGPGVFTRAMLHATGPYFIPHISVAVKGVFTNNPPGGGMRGFGAPQVTWAIESHMDQLARGLGIDPWEFRYRNAYTCHHLLPTGQPIPGNVEIRRCLEAVKPQYDMIKAEAAEKNRDSTRVRYGVGIAGAMFGIGMSGILFPGRARVSLEEDGTLTVRIGVAEVGQGTVTSLAQIAADEFGIPLHRVRIFSSDTLTEPDSGPTAASRQIFFTGKVLCSALKKLKIKMQERACHLFKREVERVTLDYSDEGAYVFPDEQRRLSLSVYDFVTSAKKEGDLLEVEDVYDPGITDYDHQAGKGRPYPVYTYSAQITEVAVDEETGSIKVLKVIAVQYIDRAIHPKRVEGQIEGSILMGIGWVLRERFISGKTGSFATYPIPRSSEAPEISTILIESNEAEGPFGAKGVGEAAILPTAPAIVNALAHATGVRFHEIPITLWPNPFRRSGAVKA